MIHCATCGAPLPPGAQFCPRCGAVVAAPPVTPSAPPPVTPAQTPPVRAARATWWIVPATIVALLLIAWLLLKGMPFGGGEDRATTTRVATETIAEGTATTAPPSSTPSDSGTVVDLTETQSETTPPNVATSATTSTATSTVPVTPPPRTAMEITPPPPAPRETPPPAPRPVETTPPPSPSSSAEISESEAVAVLRGYVTSRDYYGIGAACTNITSHGYRNVGYTMEVFDSCSHRMLGRWRVDAKTREVFRQQDDGRYLRP
ncbi:MAG: zinc ribbon domain-containing protein [Acidobacteria bacterium]|nr:zinc ribbon domain-containing protein [Acidobacteriota bacterium]MBV9476789.1 zinc ribbon domain-containing protein [Acidobacteriota bacterium]